MVTVMLSYPAFQCPSCTVLLPRFILVEQMKPSVHIECSEMGEIAQVCPGCFFLPRYS